MERLKTMAMIILAIGMVMALGCASMGTMAKKSTLTELTSTLTPVKAAEIAPATATDIKSATDATAIQTSKETPPLPLEGKYAVVNEAGFEVISTSLEKTEFTILVDSGQMKTKWQIFASWAWTDGKQWSLITQDDYQITTTETSSGLIAIMKFPDKGIGWYWVRIWGQNKKSENWLWINQKSEYCRNDTQGNPGYEVLVHPASGKHQAVSTKYQTRK